MSSNVWWEGDVDAPARPPKPEIIIIIILQCRCVSFLGAIYALVPAYGMRWCLSKGNIVVVIVIPTSSPVHTS